MSTETVNDSEESVIPVETEKGPTHLLLYTDGGCKPQRGHGGWGVHGYAFTKEPAKTGIGHPTAIPTAMGYQLGSGKPDITIHWYVDNYGSILPECTNNVAELQAAIEALKIVAEKQVPNVALLMDAAYVMDGLSQYVYNWEKAGWRKASGELVSNAGLWKELHSLRNTLVEQGITIHFQKVKGHSGEPGNDLVDEYATIAMEMGRNGYPRNQSAEYKPAKGYWAKKSNRTRMLNCGHWFFNADMNNGVSQDGRSVYHQSDLRSDLEYFGKPVSDASFSVVFLKEPEVVLDQIRQVTYGLGNRINHPIFAGYLREIYRPALYDRLEQHGAGMLLHDFVHGRLFTATKQLIVEELRPAGLAYRGASALNVLEQRLEDFLNPPENSRIRKTEITDLFYKTEEKGKTVTTKLLPKITSTTESMEVEAAYYIDSETDAKLKIKLILAQDLPDRNTLSALADPTAKVHVITWPAGPHAVHYATIVESMGDIGIWAGIYSNLAVIPEKK